MEGLSIEFGNSWEALAERLEFSEAEIEGFDRDNKELKIKSDRMLSTWKRREASSATYEVLYKALCQKLLKLHLFPNKATTNFLTITDLFPSYLHCQRFAREWVIISLSPI